eukprot:GFYU01005147.1.p2 GENE.GFYU01005147.1~~GFYU01005147.1.p2  ORF type:complete len:161 (+),score=56.70 GFYU01005147.1:64-546(+)
MDCSCVAATWPDVQNDNTETNWCLYEVSDDGKSLQPVGAGTGTGGLNEFKGALDDSKVMFGAIRVNGIDDRGSTTSKRAKFIQVIFIGESVPPMKRAKVSMAKGPVAQAFGSVAITVDASSAGDLTTEDLVARLLACGGAHKPTSYEFGPDLKVELPPHT